MPIEENLLSGLIGAIIGSAITILYNEFVAKRTKEYMLAKERLEKIYSPLLLIQKANQKQELEENIYFNDEEKRLIDNIIRTNFYLIEPEFAKLFIEMYSHNAYHSKVPGKEFVSMIKKGYLTNKRKIGFSNETI